MFKVFLRRVSLKLTKNYHVTYLLACVSFDSTGLFEEHCVAVSATAELGINGDFCVTLSSRCGVTLTGLFNFFLPCSARQKEMLLTCTCALSLSAKRFI